MKVFLSIILEEKSMQEFISAMLIKHYGFHQDRTEEGVNMKKTRLLKKGNTSVFFAFPGKSGNGGNTFLLKELTRSLLADYQYSLDYENIIKCILWDSDGQSIEDKKSQINKKLSGKNYEVLDYTDDFSKNGKNKSIFHGVAHVNLESWLLPCCDQKNIKPLVVKNTEKKLSQKIKKSEDINVKEVYNSIVNREYRGALKKGATFGEYIDIKRLKSRSTSFSAFIDFLEKTLKLDEK